MPNEIKFKSNVKSEKNKSDKDFNNFSSQIKNLELKLSKSSERSNTLEKKNKRII